MTLVHEDGRVLEIPSVSQFYKENPEMFSIHSIRSLSCGRRCSIKGWYSKNSPKFERLYKHSQRTIVNIKTGERIKLGRNKNKALAGTDLTVDRVDKLVNNRETRTTYKGWVTEETYNTLYGAL